MKVAKIFFRVPDYYIHGTGQLLTVGEEGSHGCLRLTPEDVMELGKLVMEHGGRSKPDQWYEQALRRRSETLVRLHVPVGIYIVP